MARCQLDHLLIAAATLDAGVAHVRETLGVTVPFGGKHPLMGTHNCLVRLGPDCFLEIIAVDHEAPKPGRLRWFGLDDMDISASIAERPRLHTWVCRTDNIAGAASASPMPTGPVEEGRRGDLIWQITIPKDGSMPEGGLFPTLIQWSAHLGADGPAPLMADLRCELESLIISHPEPTRLRAALAAIGADGLALVEKGSGGLSARVRTPGGIKELS